jgi:hypothetical protein
LQLVFLPGLKIAANLSILSVAVATLRQFFILPFMKAVDLTVETGSQVAAGIWDLRTTRRERERHRKQEEPEYEGILCP